jgi:hypothetical protein
MLMPLPGFDKSVRLGPFFDAGNVFTDDYTFSDEGLAHVGGPDCRLDLAARTAEIQLWSANQRAK